MGEGREYITHTLDNGTVNISADVVAVIAAAAAMEVEGVSGLAMTPGKSISEIIRKKNLSRSVHIQIGTDSVVTDLYILTKMGVPVSDVGCAVQARVQAAVESMTGFRSEAVNVHVCGVSLEK